MAAAENSTEDGGRPALVERNVSGKEKFITASIVLCGGLGNMVINFSFQLLYNIKFDVTFSYLNSRILL